MASPRLAPTGPASRWMPIRELSRRTGISPDLLRKWERRYALTDPERTPGGHRLYSRVDEARVRLMLDGVSRGMRPAQAAEHALGARLAVKERPAAPGAAERVRARRQAIVRALAAYDEGRADSAVEPLEAELVPVELVRQVYWPLVTEPGAVDRDALGPVIAAWVQRRLGRLCAGWDRGAGPRALLAADESGAAAAWVLCFGIALRGFGWRITALGSEPSGCVLRRALRHLQPRVVVLAAADLRRAGDALAGWDGGSRRLYLALLDRPVPDDDVATPAGGDLLDPDPVTAPTRLAI